MLVGWRRMTRPSLLGSSTVIRPAMADDVDAIVEVHIRGRSAYYD